MVFNAGHFLAKRGSWATRFLNDAFRIFPWPATRSNTGMVEIGGWLVFVVFFWGGEAGVVGEKAIQAIYLFFDKTIGILKVLEGGHVGYSRAGLLGKRRFQAMVRSKRFRKMPFLSSIFVFWLIQRKNGMTRAWKRLRYLFSM